MSCGCEPRRHFGKVSDCMRRTVILLAILLLQTAIASAKDKRWMLHVGPVFGQSWLGSEDKRRGAFYGLQYSKSDPQLFAMGHEGELVIEAYYMYTIGGGFRSGRFPKNNSHHYGVMALARYWNREPTQFKTFVEIGWGLQYVDKRTHDLGGLFNTTPTLGIGMKGPFEGYELILGMRYMHVSNAGVVGNNEGHNFFHFYVGVQF